MSSKNSNWFVRGLIVLLACVLGALALMDFLNPPQENSLNAEIITLLGLMMILVLSESFDNFQLGKVISLSRKVKDQEQDIEERQQEANQLRQQLIQLSNNLTQNQSQNSTNIIGFSEDIIKQMAVEQASAEEILQKRQEENEGTQVKSETKPRRKINYAQLEQMVFDEFLKDRALNESSLIREAKLITQFSGIDAVSNIHPIYDGYINNGEKELFIEIKTLRYANTITEKLYLKLNKVYLYNKLRNANSHLVLVLVNTESEADTPQKMQRQVDKLKAFFEPSLVRGNLQIETMELSETECRDLCEVVT